MLVVSWAIVKKNHRRVRRERSEKAYLYSHFCGFLFSVRITSARNYTTVSTAFPTEFNWLQPDKPGQAVGQQSLSHAWKMGAAWRNGYSRVCIESGYSAKLVCARKSV